MLRFLTVWICAAACGAGGLFAGEPAAPRFEGSSLPVPPQQSAPWTPPKTRLSSRLIAATRTLFAQGLADPRGCEYREIETGEGEGQTGVDADERGVFKSHGWVLPADPARPQRFAVRCNGLVYPVLTVGPAADLRADVTKIMEAKKGQVVVEWSDEYLIRLCLLLRLGERQLAEKYFDHLTAGGLDLCDPYLLLAQEWTWSLFTRAANAHMRGDDNLSLLTARALTRIWAAVEAEATELDLPRPKSQTSDDKDAPSDEIPLYLEELKPIRRNSRRPGAPRRAAQAEERRAVASRRFGPFLCGNPLAGKMGMLRISGNRLSENWVGTSTAASELRSRFVGLRRHRDTADSLAELLRPYRDEAVEPLLNCLENDTRLSRGGEFAFPQHGFKLEGVDQLAYSVVCCLLEAHFEAYFLHELTRDERKSLVERIRAHWHKIRSRSPADGWYEILRDDSQPPDRWVEAVKKTIGYSGPLVRDAKESAARREAMQKKRDPTMSELLVKRAGSLAERRSMGQAAEMALALAEWDPKVALPVLRHVAARWHEVLLDESPQKDRGIHWIPPDLVKLTLARAKLNDASALPEYVQLLRDVSFRENSYSEMEIFEPLLKYRDAPEVVAGAEWIFNDPASRWKSILRIGKKAIHFQSPIFMLGRNPLMTLPAFRKLVLRTLGRHPSGRYSRGPLARRHWRCGHWVQHPDIRRRPALPEAGKPRGGSAMRCVCLGISGD